jgi:molecular chaperone DnaK (HSP70)
VAEAARHQEEDQQRMEQIEAKNGFERFLFQLKQTMTSSEVVEKVPAPERAQVDAMITQQLAWLSR